VPIDYDAVLDLEELRLMNVAREANANNHATADGLQSLEDAAIEGLEKGRRSSTPSDCSPAPRAGIVESISGGLGEPPQLRSTVAYMLAIAQFGSVKEMLRRIVARKSVGETEKVQLISVLLRRIHQKYAALARAE